MQASGEVGDLVLLKAPFSFVSTLRSGLYRDVGCYGQSGMQRLVLSDVTEYETEGAVLKTSLRMRARMSPKVCAIRYLFALK